MVNKSASEPVIQVRITEKRRKTWKSWCEQCKYEIPAQILWSAVESALKLAEIKQTAKKRFIIDAALLEEAKT